MRRSRGEHCGALFSLKALVLALMVNPASLFAARAQVIHYPNGFAGSTCQIWLENSAMLSGSAIQLTQAGVTNEANNAWFETPVNAYTSAQSVTITGATAGATIYYTTDGTIPTSSSTKYTSPIAVSITETLHAIGVGAGDTASAVASAVYTITAPANFTIEASPAALTVEAGSKGTHSLTVMPANGFSSAVNFACSGLPAGDTCTFAPATVTPSGGAVSTQRTIATNAIFRSANGHPLFASVLCACVERRLSGMGATRLWPGASAGFDLRRHRIVCGLRRRLVFFSRSDISYTNQFDSSSHGHLWNAPGDGEYRTYSEVAFGYLCRGGLLGIS